MIGGTELAVFGVWAALQLDVSSSNAVKVVFSGLLTLGNLGLWVLDMMAVGRVGVWMSLGSRKPAQAWAKTVFWVMLAPWFALVPATMFCFGFLTPFLLFLKDLLFINWANSNLRFRFRTAAAAG
jgi:hypothetical protein